MIKLLSKLGQWAYFGFYRALYFPIDRAGFIAFLIIGLILGSILTWGVP